MSIAGTSPRACPIQSLTPMAEGLSAAEPDRPYTPLRARVMPTDAVQSPGAERAIALPEAASRLPLGKPHAGVAKQANVPSSSPKRVKNPGNIGLPTFCPGMKERKPLNDRPC